MSKVFKVVVAFVVFLRTPQGKRDVALCVAGVSGAYDLLHRAGVV